MNTKHVIAQVQGGSRFGMATNMSGLILIHIPVHPHPHPHPGPYLDGPEHI